MVGWQATHKLPFRTAGSCLDLFGVDVMFSADLMQPYVLEVTRTNSAFVHCGLASRRAVGIMIKALQFSSQFVAAT